MVNELFVNTKLTMVPIVRNDQGLALSSRNKYLSPEYLEISSNIYRGLSKAHNTVSEATEGTAVDREVLISSMEAVWSPYIHSGDFKVDYISIADFNTLSEMSQVKKTDKVVISCAVNVYDKNTNNTVRLIDNIVM